jgi:hypothetical protein
MKDNAVVKAFFRELFKISRSDWHVRIKFNRDVSMSGLEQDQTSMRHIFLVHQGNQYLSMNIKLPIRLDKAAKWLTKSNPKIIRNEQGLNG